VIINACDLWKELTQKRNFDEKYYDLEEAKIIKKKLSLPTDKTIYMGLKKNKVSVEKFIKVFFEANASYTLMMNDLLNMFEEIGAKETDNKLEISFEFEKDKPHTVNLDSFKSMIQKWDIVDENILLPNIINPSDYFTLSESLSELGFENRNLELKQVDCETYILKFGLTKNNELDILLKSYENLFNEIINNIDRYKIANKNYSEYNNKFNYIRFAFDNAPWFIINKIEVMIKEISLNKITNISDIINLLDEFLINIEFNKITTKEKVEVFEEFLDLPFWKKRHELYSVWVFAVIYNVIKKYEHKVHVINGKLIFPFKETHLATIYQNKNIYIYCEKKTQLINPIGKGRKRNIQPDYSFYIEPLSDINSSILEIECKQYKQQNSDNFARALIDYSNGRPKSQVFLVNHGDVNYKNIEKKAIKLVNDFDKKRCKAFGNIISNSLETKELQKEIESILLDTYLISENSKIKVKLTWGINPKDLDLSCDFDGSAKYTINYKNKSFNNKIFFKDDITNGYGPEEIEFTVYENAKYNFFVNDYHKTKGLKDSKLKVEFFIDEELIKSIELDESFTEEDIWNICLLNIIKLNNKEYFMNFEL